MTETVELLGGHYELGADLGTGPLGRVRRGRDWDRGMDVAVKLLRPELAEDPELRRRVRELAALATGVDHPRAVPLIGVVEDGDEVFVVGGQVNARTLRAVLDESGPLPVAVATTVGADVCDALEAVQASGLIHRGVHPGNVFVRGGRGVLADAGVNAATLLGATGPWTAPEAAGGEVDGRADVYSVGACVYEALTGVAWQPGSTTKAVRELRDDCPPAIEAAISTALAARPEDRQPSPAALGAALRPDRAAEAAPVAPRPVAVSAPSQPAPAGRNRPLLLAAITGLVGLLVGALVAGLALGGRDDQPAADLAAATAEPEAAETATEPEATETEEEALEREPESEGETEPEPTERETEPEPAPPPVLPDVAGRQEAEAVSGLQEVGAVLGTVRRVRNPATAPGSVLGSEPGAGTEVTEGLAVTLVVSSGTQPITLEDLIAVIDEDPAAAGPRAPTFRGRLAKLPELQGEARAVELADLIGIAEAGATNGDFSPAFGTAAAEVLRTL